MENRDEYKKNLIPQLTHPPPRPFATAWRSGIAPSPKVSHAWVVPKPASESTIVVNVNGGNRLTAHPAHDFIQNEESSVFVAYRFHSFQVTFRWRNYTRCCAHYCLRDNYKRSQKRTENMLMTTLHPITVSGPSSWNLSSSSCRNLSTYSSSVSSGF